MDLGRSAPDLPRATDAYLEELQEERQRIQALHSSPLGRQSPLGPSPMFGGPPSMVYRPNVTRGESGGRRRPVPQQFLADEEGMRDEIRELSRRVAGVESEKAELRARVARAERELQRREKQIDELLAGRSNGGGTATSVPSAATTATAPGLRAEASLVRSLRERVRLLEVAVGDKENEIFRLKNSPEWRAAAEGERLRGRQRSAAAELGDLQERALHLRTVCERLKESNAKLAMEAELWQTRSAVAEGAVAALERELEALPAGERRSLAEAGAELQRLREQLRSGQRASAAAENVARQAAADRAARLAGLEQRLAARADAVARLQEERDRLERLLRLEEAAAGRHAAEVSRGQRQNDSLQRRIGELEA